MRRKRELPITSDVRDLIEKWRLKALENWSNGDNGEAVGIDQCAKELAEVFGIEYTPNFY